MKTEDQLIRKLNRKLDRYNRKARKYGYPTLWYDFKKIIIRGWSAMSYNNKVCKLPGILGFFYAIYLEHLHGKLLDISYKIWVIEFMEKNSNKTMHHSQK